MPAGISEGLIRRAFAPIDLSYAYQRLDATQRILNAEDRALKQQAQKDYYTELASIKKDLGGVRSEDIAEIGKKYKQWADVSRQLAANPRLITKNPEKYGELKSQADTLYGQTLKDIEESKEMKKLLQATTEKLGDVRNFDLLDEGAYEKFKQNALFRPTKELVQSGAYSFNNYLSPIIDPSKFYEANNKMIDSGAIIKDIDVEDKTFSDVSGRRKMDKLKNIPIESSIYNKITANLNSIKKGNVLAQQELDKFKQSGEDTRILNAYDNFYNTGKNKGFENYINQDTRLVYNPSAAPKDKYATLLSMREFVNRAGIMTREEGLPKLGDVEAIKLRQRLRDLSEKGAAVAATQGYNDAWTDIKSRLSKSPDATSLDRFSIPTQGIILDMVKGAGLDANNRDVYLKEDRNTGEVGLYTMKEFSYLDDNKNKVVVYKKNQKIGGLDGAGINIAASIGVKGKTAALGQAESTRGALKPLKSMK